MATETTYRTVEDAARAMDAAFTTDTRNDGATYWKLRDGSPAWMTDVVRAGHGPDFFPDDWRYEFIQNAVNLLAECSGDEDAARDSIESDIYTSDLTRWIASNLLRFGYCDEAMAEYGPVDDTIRLLQMGQHMEREEVFTAVYNALVDLVESEPDEDDA